MLCSFIFFSFWMLAIASVCLLCCMEFDMQVTEVSQIWLWPKKVSFLRTPLPQHWYFLHHMVQEYSVGVEAVEKSWVRLHEATNIIWKLSCLTTLTRESPQTTNKCTPDHSWGKAEIDKSFKNQNMLSIHRAFFKGEWKWGTVSDKAFPLDNTILTFNL